MPVGGRTERREYRRQGRHWETMGDRQKGMASGDTIVALGRQIMFANVSYLFPDKKPLSLPSLKYPIHLIQHHIKVLPESI